jgi:hypothetical protein
MDEQLYKNLLDLIETFGVKAAVGTLAEALSDYADTMSDMGLKEKAVAASEASELLFKVEVVLREN